ncbi:MAG: PAS domain S-box protein [Minwuia sp.]|uniref:PAS domain S-box protein n=1 Tax=Minwuia sp. TaxID=2493630 RepID=UPI003A84B77B
MHYLDRSSSRKPERSGHQNDCNGSEMPKPSSEGGAYREPRMMKRSTLRPAGDGDSPSGVLNIKDIGKPAECRCREAGQIGLDMPGELALLLGLDDLPAKSGRFFIPTERLLDQIHPDDRAFARMTTEWARTADKDTGRLKVRMRRADGGWVPVRIQCGNDGGAFLSLSADEAETLRRAELKLRQIVEGARQAATVTVGKRVVYANPALAPMLGYKSLEHMRRDGAHADHTHPDDREMVYRRQSARMAGGVSPGTYEFRMVRLDGGVIWVECFTSEITWGSKPASLAWLVDITARKHAEESLRRSEELFGVLFRACPDMMLLASRSDGRIVDVNESFLDVTGHDRDKVIGRTGEELSLLADPGIARQLALQARQSQDHSEIDTVINLAGGGSKQIAVSARDISFAGNDLTLFVARDVTERRRQEQALQDSMRAADLANRAKSEFLANMSHELRTPLNAIIGFSEMISREMAGPVGSPKYLGYAQDIHGSGRHLLQIINDLLDLSKLEAGKLELHEEAFGLSDLIADCLRIVSHRAAEAKVTLEVDDTDAPDMCCRADPRLIKQILFNLLSNAIKFTPRGGKIRIVLSRHDTGALGIAVEDTGVGMTDDEIVQALTPFGQVASAHARPHQGTGLGLPIVKSLVELHDGAFEVKSRPGQGTTAAVQLPEARILPAG